MSSKELSISNIYQIPPFTTGFGKTPIPKQIDSLTEIATKIADHTDYRIVRYEGLANHKPYNYLKVFLRREEEEEIGIFCNRFVPLLAFVQKTEQGFVFWEKKEWEKWVSKPFRVLSPAYLAIRPDADDPVAAQALGHLDYSEFAEIVYRMPETLGEIVFNDWH